MKRVTLDTGLHERDIRPAPLMTEFMRLSIINSLEYFSDPGKLVEVLCPACGSEARERAFRKHTFVYCRCGECGSLFTSPRPDRDVLLDYYENSAASHYRVEHFGKETARARRQHLLGSHAQWLDRIVDEQGNCDSVSFGDVHTQSVQLFNEIRQLDIFERLYSIAPLHTLDVELHNMGVTVVRDEVKGLGAVTSLGQLENRFSPLEHLEKLGRMLAANGIVTLTTRTSSGFDILLLWESNPYIFVPEHMNLLSIEGLAALVERAGLHLLELSTPGQLDLELVQHAQTVEPTVQLPRHIDYLLRCRGEEARTDFQQFLQKHRLSSHVRIAAVAKKGEDA